LFDYPLGLLPDSKNDDDLPDSNVRLQKRLYPIVMWVLTMFSRSTRFTR
jgi:hypothetical protein